MVNHILTWAFKSISVFLSGIIITILGLPIVAIALPFRKYGLDIIRFTQYTELGYWKKVTLPKWARWWSNEFDGAYGDKRGWWANNCIEKYNKQYNQFFPMWMWLAVRNPANYWSRVVTGIDVSECTIKKLAGQDIVSDSIDELGWQFLVAEREDGKLFHSLRFAFPWFFSENHIIYGWFGWKLKLSHNAVEKSDIDSMRLKGSVFRVSFWKKI